MNFICSEWLVFWHLEDFDYFKTKKKIFTVACVGLWLPLCIVERCTLSIAPQSFHKDAFLHYFVWWKRLHFFALVVSKFSKFCCCFVLFHIFLSMLITLESEIDVGQGINVGPGKFVKKNKHRALNKRRAWTKCAKLCYKNPLNLKISVGHGKNSKI